MDVIKFDVAPFAATLLHQLSGRRDGRRVQRGVQVAVGRQHWHDPVNVRSANAPPIDGVNLARAICAKLSESRWECVSHCTTGASERVRTNAAWF
eukprot:5718662-Prymnesium_polylepis.1